MKGTSKVYSLPRGKGLRLLALKYGEFPHGFDDRRTLVHKNFGFTKQGDDLFRCESSSCHCPLLPSGQLYFKDWIDIRGAGQGIIATNPITGYAFNDELKMKYGLPDQIDGFLIDANVFPGSSGSVVILRPQSIIFGPDGNMVISKTKKIPYLLGIVSGSIPIEDTALQSSQRMGLGIVYSADAIKETIEQFYINNQLS